MSKEFNEMTRVQMPAMVHLTKLGYKYYGRFFESDANIKYEPNTNILLEPFKRQFMKLNPNYKGNFNELLNEIVQELDNDDIGKTFYKKLLQVSPYKLIDFENIENNEFGCTAEFECINGEDAFRPDITLFINGLPLTFIEVKKPNNHQGILAEKERFVARFSNRKFRRFINITQLMIYSNNMEYNKEGGIVPIEGAFYCTASREKAFYSVFREENPLNADIAPFNNEYKYLDEDQNIEKQILKDFNCQVIHDTKEYNTNKNINTPTNRIITSMCSKERLLYILKYGIAYYHSEIEEDGKVNITDEKHIMRYQQLFATLAIREKINKGTRAGVVWHTQGSGKTALAYHLNKILTDYFATKNKVAKFYFIVDRLDLMKQAKDEFAARGLIVKTANSRNELMQQFRSQQSQENDSGNPEVTVVNIQRFSDADGKIDVSAYSNNLQRIFIIDEAHRGYKPEGSFLGNLLNSDKNSIKIALTGTPLLKEERESWRIFGEYYHTYYYDKSIEDGYTLKVLREPIETKYKENLENIYKELEILVEKKDIKKSYIIEHETYVNELIRFIINDFDKYRIDREDESLGGMVICESSEQARKIYDNFYKIQKELNEQKNDPEKTDFKVGLVLYDSDDKDTQEKLIKDFRKNMKIDILIVFNMLLTGFDAPRLKRIYFGRKLKEHNLLQAVTRVNRPYKEMRYGTIVDFADIKEEFDKTNAVYLNELNRFNNPDQLDIPNNVFQQVLESSDEIINQMKFVKERLFSFPVENLEEFNNQITYYTNKDELIDLRKALISARDLSNLVKTFGDDELKQRFKKVNIPNLSTMIINVQDRINIINQEEAFINNDDKNEILINRALYGIKFKFNPLDPEELKIIAGQETLDKKWNRTIETFINNEDHEDPEYIALSEAFKERFKEFGFKVDTLDEYKRVSKELEDVIKKIKELDNRNKVIKSHYNNDIKFARIHKRIVEENKRRELNGKQPIISNLETEIRDYLNYIKDEIDNKVYDRSDILKKDAYFEQTVMEQISKCLDDLNYKSDRSDRLFIQSKLTTQYLNQYNAQFA